jgi:hypothetical protein
MGEASIDRHAALNPLDSMLAREMEIKSGIFFEVKRACVQLNDRLTQQIGMPGS